MQQSAIHRESLTAGQRRAVVALLQQPTVKDAAKAAAIGERTIHKWLREDAFKRALWAAQDAALAAAIARLSDALPIAVDALVQICQNADEPATARVSAARAILEQYRLAREFGELAGRVDELERILKQ